MWLKIIQFVGFQKKVDHSGQKMIKFTIATIIVLMAAKKDHFSKKWLKKF